MRCAPVVVAGLLALTAGTAIAQCPDGTPPPCRTARRAGGAARAVPSPEARARRFLLLPFRNVTRGAAQDWLVTGAPLMLGEALGQFRDLEVIPEATLTAARRRLALPADSSPDATQLRRLAEETDGWTAVSGNVFANGGRLRISVQALDVPTARVLVRGETDVAVDADVRDAFDRLSVRLLEATGVRVSAAPDLTVHSTQSVEAYRAYVRGVEFMQRSAYRRAKTAFAEAVRLDSTFALAWAKLAMASIGADLWTLLDPANPAMLAVGQAVRTGARLPARQAQLVRAMQFFFTSRVDKARRLADSLVATDRDDLDAREFLASMELMDLSLDTTAVPPRSAGSLNRALALARDVLERDPGRRNVYSVIALAYWGTTGMPVGRVRGEFGSWPALLQHMQTQGPDAVYVPVLRDSIVLMPKDAFDRLPDADRAAMRLRSADAAMDWVERWLTAGPGDADAHLWASRFAELRDDVPRALREIIVAESLGVESGFDNVPGRHVILLARAGQLAAASALADSLVKSGALAKGPNFPGLNPGRGYAAAAFLLARNWARVAALADASGPGRNGASSCLNLINDLNQAGRAAPVSIALRIAIMDTVAVHFAEVASFPALAPCVGNLSVTLVTDSTTVRRTRAGAALLAAADSLSAAGNTALAYRAARFATLADTARRGALSARPWFVQRSRALSPGSHFVPGVAIVDADSALFSFTLADKTPIELTDPAIVVNWAFQVELGATATSGASAGGLTIRLAHTWSERNPAASGGVAELIAAIQGRTVSANPPNLTLSVARPAVTATADGFRVVVRGAAVTELRRLRPAMAVFSAEPCLAVAEGVCGRPAVPIVYR